MTNLNNGDLYNMMLDRIRKDQRGIISPEEFESFLRWRSLDKFGSLIKVEGENKLNQEALLPFYVHHDPISVTSSNSVYYIPLQVLSSGTTTTTTPYSYIDYNIAVLVNTWATSSYTDFSSLTHIDLVSSSELSDRLNNAITLPSTEDPVGYLEETKLWIWGVTSGYILLDYYRYPTQEYFDYYTDSVGNVTYLTDGQSSYTLQSGEVARDGTAAGGAVTSASVDTEWDDEEALQMLDMIVSDVSIALSEPESFQASLLERKENA